MLYCLNNIEVRCTREQGTLLEISGKPCFEKDVDVKELYSTIMKK